MTNVWPNGSLSIPTVTSEWGPRDPIWTPGGWASSVHQGIDLVGFDEIISPVTGVVTFAGYNGGAGNEVRIREDGTGDVIRLFHNRALNVSTGQRVSQGQLVAWMGTTGASTGKHCHEETRPGGGASINPRSWYAARNSSTAGGGSSPFPGSVPTTGEDMLLVNNVSVPGQFYIATWDSMTPEGFPNRLTVRPTLGVEAGILLAAVPQIPRCQMKDEVLVDFCAQGGYVWDEATQTGYSYGVPIFHP